ncbi:GNAT family N-acetyltransferase [Actinoplanes sp. TRM 88003]|uniref:GNAT family N-acetyltransferase n=1 Tax=Paractinoplanes aksuensis TaxID=2939490 RepID=A0ABT1E4I9_9ACTN|nr:GNAT family N-acetyltransferase [Actinoplanes aksuensis]MCO8278043.1 GNAT family N-acetyltransferase [Actinoplanes aksuensis]
MNLDKIRMEIANSSDYTEIQQLADASSDGGKLNFRRERHLPETHSDSGIHDRVLNIIVRDPDSDVMIGAGKMSIGECWFAGEWRPYAFVHSAIVHPSYRRRGIASRLAKFVTQLAENEAGKGVVTVAHIQTGNKASEAANRHWASENAGRITLMMVPMLTSPPKRRPEIEIRPANEDDLDQIAEALLKRRWSFSIRWSPEKLRRWLSTSPSSQPINHYVVATDSRGRLLAGIGLREEGLVQSYVVEHPSPSFRLVNHFFRVLPADGRLRNVITDKFWYADGHRDAARGLWETIRWEWRDRGTNLLSAHDPRGPIHTLVKPGLWFPSTSGTVMIHSSQSADKGLIIDPIV